MRKLRIIIVAVLIVLIGFGTVLLPSIISSQIESRLAQKIQSDAITAEVNTSPDFMLLFGQVDTINISADNIILDKIKLKNLTLNGQDVQISVADLLLARRLVVNSAQDLTITGIIDENNLTELLNEKVDKISDIQAKISPDGVEATGKISFLGQKASVHVKGHVLVEGTDLIFRITDADTQSSLFGKIGLSFTKDIPIANSSSLPLEGMQFTNVEQQNGQVLIAASVNK